MRFCFWSPGSVKKYIWRFWKNLLHLKKKWFSFNFSQKYIQNIIFSKNMLQSNQKYWHYTIPKMMVFFSRLVGKNRSENCQLDTCFGVSMWVREGCCWTASPFVFGLPESANDAKLIAVPSYRSNCALTQVFSIGNFYAKWKSETSSSMRTLLSSIALTHSNVEVGLAQ